mgnify:CR=1 FL=1
MLRTRRIHNPPDGQHLRNRDQRQKQCNLPATRRVFQSHNLGIVSSRSSHKKRKGITWRTRAVKQICSNWTRTFRANLDQCGRQ